MKRRIREDREVVENPTGQRLVKIAELVRSQLLVLRVRRQREIRRNLDTLLLPLTQLQQTRHRLTQCLDKEWHVAAASVTGSLGSQLMELSVASDVLERSLDLSEAAMPSLREVVEDLEQLRQEFPGFRYYPQEKILAVVTEPVELEETFLGDFEIQVDLQRLGATPVNHSYKIVALDPHAATGDERVTHPHVRDEGLCAGDGSAAITSSLSAGRLCDFFTLVWAILSNYNENSPFIALSNWSGLSCHECGYVTNEDQLYYCESCDHDFCEECVSYCSKCDCTTCINCLERCPVCDERVCSGCMTTCDDCKERICVKCKEETQCLCHENEEAEDESSTNEVPVGETGASGESSGGDTAGDEGEEFAIVHVNQLDPAAEGPTVDPA